jgi:hypothetical protein
VRGGAEGNEAVSAGGGVEEAEGEVLGEEGGGRGFEGEAEGFDVVALLAAGEFEPIDEERGTAGGKRHFRRGDDDTHCFHGSAGGKMASRLESNV